MEMHSTYGEYYSYYSGEKSYFMECNGSTHVIASNVKILICKTQNSFCALTSHDKLTGRKLIQFVAVTFSSC